MIEPLIVATDGSADVTHRTGEAYSYVTVDGRHGSGWKAHTFNPTDAELRAIELALIELEQPLTILTDSQSAIQLLEHTDKAQNNWSQNQPTGLTRLVTQINKLLIRSGSTVYLIKGHSGHPLNERAHRLSRETLRKFRRNTMW